MTSEFLEEFLHAPPEFQEQFIACQREMEQAQARVQALERERLDQLEKRWLMVPKWRRAIILAAQWVQFKFTPKYI